MKVKKIEKFALAMKMQGLEEVVKDIYICMNKLTY